MIRVVFSTNTASFPSASPFSGLPQSLTPRMMSSGVPFRLATHAIAPDSQSTVASDDCGPSISRSLAV